MESFFLSILEMIYKMAKKAPITEKLIEIFTLFEPAFIQKTTGIPASTYRKFQQGKAAPSAYTRNLLYKTAKNAYRREKYHTAREKGFNSREAKQVSSYGKNRFFSTVVQKIPEKDYVTAPKRVKTIVRAVKERKTETILPKVKELPLTDRRKTLYHIAREAGLTAKEARDVRGMNFEKAVKYIKIRGAGGMVIHAEAYKDAPMSMIEDTVRRYENVAYTLSKIHGVPVEIIKKGMSINYTKERLVDDWEQYIKEKHNLELH